VRQWGFGPGICIGLDVHLVELISYPYPDHESPSGVSIQIRLEPGDPTTMVRWPVPQIDVDEALQAQPCRHDNPAERDGRCGICRKRRLVVR